MAIDLRRLESAYERGRARNALVGALPLGAVVLIACAIGTRTSVALPVGVLLLLLAGFSLFRGGEWGRSVMPGVLTGLLPLGLAFAARGCGHVCMGSACMSLCVPACTVGGLLAGGAIAYVGHRTRGGAAFWSASAGFALLTGSLGCCCVGYSGVLGLFAGLMIVLLPTLRVRSLRA